MLFDPARMREESTTRQWHGEERMGGEGEEGARPRMDELLDDDDAAVDDDADEDTIDVVALDGATNIARNCASSDSGGCC